MKNIIINILWWILNKLDPMECVGTEIGTIDNEIKIKIGKRFYRKDRWNHICLTLEAWVKKNNNETTSINNTILYKNGRAYKNRLYDEVVRKKTH